MGFCLKPITLPAATGAGVACSAAHAGYRTSDHNVQYLIDMLRLPTVEAFMCACPAALTPVQQAAVATYATALAAARAAGVVIAPVKGDAAAGAIEKQATDRQLEKHRKDAAALRAKQVELAEAYVAPHLPSAFSHGIAPLSAELVLLQMMNMVGSDVHWTTHDMSGSTTLPFGLSPLAPPFGDITVDASAKGRIDMVMSQITGATTGVLTGVHAGRIGLYTNILRDLKVWMRAKDSVQAAEWGAGAVYAAHAGFGSTWSPEQPGAAWRWSVGQFEAAMREVSGPASGAWVEMKLKSSPLAIHAPYTSATTGGGAARSVQWLVWRAICYNYAEQAKKASAVLQRMTEEGYNGIADAAASFVGAALERLEYGFNTGRLIMQLPEPKERLYYNYNHFRDCEHAAPRIVYKGDGGGDKGDKVGGGGGHDRDEARERERERERDREQRERDREQREQRERLRGRRNQQDGNGQRAGKHKDAAGGAKHDGGVVVDIGGSVAGELKIDVNRLRMLDIVSGLRGFNSKPTGRTALNSTLPLAVDFIDPPLRAATFEKICVVHATTTHLSKDCVNLLSIASGEKSALLGRPEAIKHLLPPPKAGGGRGGGGGR
jgi:hypothetical protein